MPIELYNVIFYHKNNIACNTKTGDYGKILSNENFLDEKNKILYL